MCRANWPAVCVQWRPCGARSSASHPPPSAWRRRSPPGACRRNRAVKIATAVDRGGAPRASAAGAAVEAAATSPADPGWCSARAGCDPASPSGSSSSCSLGSVTASGGGWGPRAAVGCRLRAAPDPPPMTAYRTAPVGTASACRWCPAAAGVSWSGGSALAAVAAGSHCCRSTPQSPLRKTENEFDQLLSINWGACGCRKLQSEWAEVRFVPSCIQLYLCGNSHVCGLSTFNIKRA